MSHPIQQITEDKWHILSELGLRSVSIIPSDPGARDGRTHEPGTQCHPGVLTLLIIPFLPPLEKGWPRIFMFSPSHVPSVTFLSPQPSSTCTLPRTQIPDGIPLFDENSPSKREDIDSECKGTRVMRYLQFVQAAYWAKMHLLEQLCASVTPTRCHPPRQRPPSPEFLTLQRVK